MYLSLDHIKGKNYLLYKIEEEKKKKKEFYITILNIALITFIMIVSI